MARRLFNLVTVVVLLVGLAVLALWARSDSTHDMAGLSWGAQTIWATSRQGSLELEWLSWPEPGGFAWQRFSHRIDQEDHSLGNPPPYPQRRGRFAAYRGQTGRGTPKWGIVFPHSAAVAIAATLGVAQLAPWLRRRRRARAGLCPMCGYDLRATPDRCPECGKRAAGQLSAAS